MVDQQPTAIGPEGLESPDTASQSLADALRVSFNVLRFMMVVVLVLYLFSNWEILEQNEQALVLRFGRLQETVHGPGGLVRAFPRPFEELIKVPVKQKRTLVVATQDLKLKEGEQRSAVARDRGLDPKVDGAVMTADRGLVHAQWVVTYEIRDLRQFYSNVYVSATHSEKNLIQHAVENAAVVVVGRELAVDVVRSKTRQIQLDVRRHAQEILDRLGSGIRIATLDAKPNWPAQTRQVFEQVTQAANEKRSEIDDAKKFRINILNTTAGAAYPRLEELFEGFPAARAANEMGLADDMMAEIESLILDEATGEASKLIQEAGGYKKTVLEEIQADVVQFRSLLPEFERNPLMLMNRLWVDTQLEIFGYEDLIKRYLPRGQKEIRLQLGPDPREKRKRETREYQRKERPKGDFAPVTEIKGDSSVGPRRVIK